MSHKGVPYDSLLGVSDMAAISIRQIQITDPELSQIVRFLEEIYGVAGINNLTHAPPNEYRILFMVSNRIDMCLEMTSSNYAKLEFSGMIGYGEMVAYEGTRDGLMKFLKQTIMERKLGKKVKNDKFY
jgi:hypothetical protein